MKLSREFKLYESMWEEPKAKRLIESNEDKIEYLRREQERLENRLADVKKELSLLLMNSEEDSDAEGYDLSELTSSYKMFVDGTDKKWEGRGLSHTEAFEQIMNIIKGLAGVEKIALDFWWFEDNVPGSGDGLDGTGSVIVNLDCPRIYRELDDGENGGYLLDDEEILEPVNRIVYPEDCSGELPVDYDRKLEDALSDITDADFTNYIDSHTV